MKLLLMPWITKASLIGLASSLSLAADSPLVSIGVVDPEGREMPPMVDAFDSARVSIEATRPVAEESSFPLKRMPLLGEFTISRTGDLTQLASVFVLYSGRAENGVDCES